MCTVGGVDTQRIANPSTLVRFQYGTPNNMCLWGNGRPSWLKPSRPQGHLSSNLSRHTKWQSGGMVDPLVLETSFSNGVRVRVSPLPPKL